MDINFAGTKGMSAAILLRDAKAGAARRRKIVVEALDLLSDRERHSRLPAYVHLEETRERGSSLATGMRLSEPMKGKNFWGRCARNIRVYDHGNITSICHKRIV